MRRGGLLGDHNSPLLGKAVNEMVADWTKGVGARRFSKSTKKKGPERPCYSGVFRGDEVVKWAILKELKLTAGHMLRRKAVS